MLVLIWTCGSESNHLVTALSIGVKLKILNQYLVGMTEVIEKRNLGLKELVERTEESLKQAAEGEVYSNESAIRERIEELRERS